MDTQTNAAIDAAPPQAEAPITEAPTTPVEEAAFDPNSVPAEFQPIYKKAEAYFSDKYKGYEDYQKRAQAFDDIIKDPSFVQWYNNKLNPQSKEDTQTKPQAVEELTPDQFNNIISDPKEFNKFIKEQARMIAQNELAPKIQEAQNQVDIMRRTSEIDNFAKTHEDFWQLDEKGLIEPLMRKYPKADLEDIWKIARHDFVKKEAISQAHGIVRTKQAATTERPGVSSSQTAGSVKVRNRSEAMMLAAEYHKAGKQLPDFIFESTK